MSISNIAAAINAAHEKVEGAKREGTKYAAEAGRLLIEAKVTVPHGRWDGWLREHCRFSPRTAQLYMKMHRSMQADPQRVAHLSLREAAQLLATPKPPRQPLNADQHSQAAAVIEAWRDAGTSAKASFVTEIHERGDIDLSQYKRMMQAVEEEAAAERVVEAIHKTCGMEGIKRLDAALKAGCTPRQIGKAIQAQVVRVTGAVR